MAETGTGAAPGARTRSGAGYAVAAAVALVLIAGGALHAPLLVWNASPSSPRGLYQVISGPLRTGDFVVAWLPPDAAAVADARGYLPRGVPLVKTMVAGSGDRVCARREQIRIAGRRAAERRRLDRGGRVLAWWHGCRTLGAGEIFLLGLGDPGSFDGRYFGPTRADQVVGRARLVWRA